MLELLEDRLQVGSITSITSITSIHYWSKSAPLEVRDSQVADPGSLMA